MQKVLLAVDGSEAANRAVRYVITLVKEHGPIDVHLLNVEPKPLTWQTHGMEPEAIEAHLRTIAHRALKSAETMLSDANVACHCHAQFGDVAETIAAAADKLGCHAIVMGRRGLGSIAGLLLGSVATKVLHLSDMPVILIK